MKVKSVKVVAPEDKTILNIQYTKAVAKIVIRRIPPEYLGMFLEKLKEVK